MSHDYNPHNSPVFNDERILSLCHHLDIDCPDATSNNLNFLLEVIYKQHLEILDIKEKMSGAIPQERHIGSALLVDLNGLQEGDCEWKLKNGLKMIESDKTI